MRDRLALMDGISVVAFAGLVYAALPHRRNGHPCGGELLAVFSRLFGIGALISLLAAAVLYAFNRRPAAPLVTIAVVIVIRWAGNDAADKLALRGMATAAIAGAFPPAVMISRFLIGLVAVLTSWRAAPGPRPAMP